MILCCQETTNANIARIASQALSHWTGITTRAVNVYLFTGTLKKADSVLSALSDVRFAIPARFTIEYLTNGILRSATSCIALIANWLDKQ